MEEEEVVDMAVVEEVDMVEAGEVLVEAEEVASMDKECMKMKLQNVSKLKGNTQNKDH
jgi:hypothetical protein